MFEQAKSVMYRQCVTQYYPQQTCDSVAMEFKQLPELTFQKRIALSAAPPPVARIWCCHGHQANACFKKESAKILFQMTIIIVPTNEFNHLVSETLNLNIKGNYNTWENFLLKICFGKADFFPKVTIKFCKLNFFSI